MEISNQVIHLAKERALFGFRVTVQQALRTAADDFLRLKKDARSAEETRRLGEAQQFIVEHGKRFQKNVDAAYRALLDRAMQTMYTDLRVALDRLSADDLSLIDDDTMNRQIRIDHVVKRLRDADDEHLRRLNLIIGRIHGQHDAKERENPFRPYLMARALHQVVTDMVSDRNAGALLFDVLAEELADRLPDFYRSIRDVFESNGIHAQLVAIKSLYGGSAYLQGGNGLPEQVALELNSRIIPGLKRALDVMNTTAQHEAGMAAQAPGPGLEIQDFLSGVFHAEGAAGAPASASVESAPASPLRAGSQALVDRLNQFQQRAARGEAVSTALAPEQNQLFALNEQIGPDEATKLDRVAIDLVAALFELILADRQIPDRLRAQIGRLQIPFLKTAILMPEMLRQPLHPARQLLNRMGSAAVGLDPDSDLGRKVEGEVGRIVARILADFDHDTGIFSAALAEFERFLADHFYREDPEAARNVVALEEVESGAPDGQRQPDTPAWLKELRIDQRVVDFIAKTWLRVLERERELAPAQAGSGGAGSFYDVLPDLVWSVQEKNPQERAELVRGLPGLVKRIEAGLLLLELGKEDMRRELDQLVAVHTQVLRGGGGVPGHLPPTLSELRERFRRLKPDIVVPAAPLESTRLVAELAERGVSVDLDLEREPAPSFESDADWLDAVRVGACVERWSDDGFDTGRLVWISKRHTLYLIKMKNQSLPVVYSKTSLIKALREGSLCLVEHAPVFERAVEVLLVNARAGQGQDGAQR